ncbi:MAG: HAD family hydrolase [Chloroflexota bacterium]|nr:MAG: HAD family hydrolase [Chloroflexota bacterium]
MIKAVIFDLGGTLVEYAGEFDAWPELEEPGLNAAFSVLASSGVTLPDVERFRAVAFELLPSRWRQATAGKKNLTVACLLAEILEKLGLEQPAAQSLDEAATHYERAVCAGAVAIPHGRETVAQLSAAGYQLGLISNTMFSSRAHMLDLDRFGLSAYFGSYLFSADANKWKPNRAPFDQVMAELDVNPEAAVFVGDDPGADVIGARRAGMHVIHFKSSDRFPSPGEDVTPDATIDDLRLLTPVLHSLNGRLPDRQVTETQDDWSASGY